MAKKLTAGAGWGVEPRVHTDGLGDKRVPSDKSNGHRRIGVGIPPPRLSFRPVSPQGFGPLTKSCELLP